MFIAGLGGFEKRMCLRKQDNDCEPYMILPFLVGEIMVINFGSIFTPHVRRNGKTAQLSNDPSIEATYKVNQRTTSAQSLGIQTESGY